MERSVGQAGCLGHLERNREVTWGVPGPAHTGAVRSMSGRARVKAT